MVTPDTSAIRRHLEALVGERNPFSSPQALEAAGAYIQARFRECEFEVWREEVIFDGRPFFNVFGELSGTHPERGVMIVGAHYDTVEQTPGADDNASAVAALLEIARCLKDTTPPLPILFAGFTLEEYAFVGSQHLCARLGKEAAPVAGMISLEMLGYRSRAKGSQTYPPYVDASRYPEQGDFIAVVGNEVSAHMTQSMADIMKQAVPGLGVEILVVPGTGQGFQDVQLSDHAPFWERGDKAVMLTDTAFYRNPHYHQPSDTLDTLDLEFIRDISEGVCAYLAAPKT